MTIDNMSPVKAGSNRSEPQNQNGIDLNNADQLRAVLISYTQRVAEAERQLAVITPKAEAYDEFIHRSGEISIDDAAKMLLGWSGVRLFARLRAARWISRRNGTNTPMLWAIEHGLMVVRPKTLPHGHIYSQPMLTPKGASVLRLAVRGDDLFLRPHSD